MECRIECGACCIAPSISTALPGMPNGKLAGINCSHLTRDFRCELFGKPNRPEVCASFKPLIDVCGENREQAMEILTTLERVTK